jgi:hypothetical protein
MTVVFVEFHFRGHVVKERAIDELLAQSSRPSQRCNREFFPVTTVRSESPVRNSRFWSASANETKHPRQVSSGGCSILVTTVKSSGNFAQQFVLLLPGRLECPRENLLKTIAVVHGGVKEDNVGALFGSREFVV